jgi:hypothetical protein
MAKTNNISDEPTKQATDATAQVPIVTPEPPEPPLAINQKIWAGIIIIVAICFSLWMIIAHWPDKLPTSADNTTYRYKLMHVTLLNKPDQTGAKPLGSESSFKTEKDSAKRAADSVAFVKAEAERVAKNNKPAAEKVVAEKKNPCASITNEPYSCTIQFSVLILILVAAAGFLGNMVFVASSFAAFVGSGKFRHSWILWYFVKPFTAAGLSTFLYLALNNSNSLIGAGNVPINLNGIIAIAALAGLFTDLATEKLRDIFIAIVKPSDNGPGKQTEAKVVSVDLQTMQPAKIDVNAPNSFQIKGQNLDPANLIVTILKKKIEPITVTPTQINFTYTVDTADKDATKFPLLITDAKGIKIAEKDIDV